jgi:hypothetical protein
MRVHLWTAEKLQHWLVVYCVMCRVAWKAWMHCCERVFHMLADGAQTELETWRRALSRLDGKQIHYQELPFVYDKSRPILNASTA